jgi:hypothetical protein
MKKIQKKPKRNYFLKLLKAFVLAFLLYSLFYVACSEEEVSKEVNSCPFSPETMQFYRSKVPATGILFENLNLKFKEYQENSEILKEITEKLIKVQEYYHYSAQVFVFTVIPKVTGYYLITRDYLVDVVFPFIREKIKISAVFLRQNYPTESIEKFREITIEKISQVKKLVLDLQVVQDLLKNQQFQGVLTQLSVISEKIMYVLGLWFQYILVGFDFLWRVLEDDVSSQEFSELSSNLRDLFKLPTSIF